MLESAYAKKCHKHCRDRCSGTTFPAAVDRDEHLQENLTGDEREGAGTHTCRAYGEVRVGVHKDFELAEDADQQVCKVPVNDSREVGLEALREV